MPRPALRAVHIVQWTLKFGWLPLLVAGLVVVSAGNALPGSTHLAFSTSGKTVVRLHNRDAKTYRLYVRHESSAVHTSIGPRTVTNICSGACTIEVKETGTKMSANPGDTVVIEAGKLRM